MFAKHRPADRQFRHTTRRLAGRSRVVPALGLALCLIAPSRAATPQDLLTQYTAASGTAAAAARGQQFFLARHGKEWSCASCHTASPGQPGRHAATGKVIQPLAPAFNVERFSDAAKTEKWFRRNCNDVLGRECSPAEKADVLAWLVALKP